MYSKQRNMTDIAREFALAQQQSRDEAASINNWYQLRRNQAMMELERLENAYNERMAEHSVEWAQRLSNYMIEQGDEAVEQGEEADAMELEQAPSVEALPIPRLERQTNVQYVPANLIEGAIPLPDLWDLEFLNGLDVLAPVAAERVVAIVSDDEGSDDEDYAMDIC